MMDAASEMEYMSYTEVRLKVQHVVGHIKSLTMTEHKHNFPASSATNGFFQEPPVLSSAFEEDQALKRVNRCEYHGPP